MHALTIGGTTVAVRSLRGRRGFAVDRLHRPFLGPGGSPVLGLVVRPLPTLPPPAGPLRFDSGIGWQVFQTPRGWSLRFTDGRAPRPRLYQALEADRAWARATLYMRSPRPSEAPALFFLAHPLEQLLFVSLLGRAGGLVVHATGVIRNGQGWVFAGPHGAGKSTLANLLTVDGATPLLSDDRVVVRRRRGRWRVYGTPWSGTVRTPTSPASAPLAGIFFIRHGRQTVARPLAPGDALRRLLPRCLHPYWDRGALGRLIEDAGALTTAVATYDFPFAPDAGAVARAVETLGR